MFSTCKQLHEPAIVFFGRLEKSSLMKVIRSPLTMECQLTRKSYKITHKIGTNGRGTQRTRLSDPSEGGKMSDAVVKLTGKERIFIH